MIPDLDKIPLWRYLLVFLCAITLIPCVPDLIPGAQDFNPLNSGTYSLSMEYFANIVYALVLRRLPRAALYMLWAVSAFLTLDLSLGWNVFGIIAEPTYSVIGGWNSTPDQLYVSLVRLSYPFITGRNAYASSSGIYHTRSTSPISRLFSCCGRGSGPIQVCRWAT